MKPTIGRIVDYKLNADDANQINRRRTDARTGHLIQERNGAQVHWGNDVKTGQVVSAIITHVAANYINVKCLLDGNDDYWKPSLNFDPDVELRMGTWNWPSRES